jgi:hypothetical protein
MVLARKRWMTAAATSMLVVSGRHDAILEQPHEETNASWVRA